MTRDEAKAFINDIVKLRSEATDQIASKAINVYPQLHGQGKLIPNGTRINWNGDLMRAAVDLFDNEQSTPDAAPTLWEKIEYKNGIRIIPESITPGKAFSRNEKGLWKDKIYISQLDSNVWTPEGNPNAWEEEIL